LIREGKGFTLTPAGSCLFEQGRTLILALTDLEKRIGDDPVREGVVRVASPGSVGLKLYPSLLDLQKQYPKLVIDYRFAPNGDIERLIVDQTVDIGLMTRQSPMAEVALEAISEEELLLVTPATIVTPDWNQLHELGFIDHPDGAHHATQLLGVNFSEFQHINQFKRSGFSNQINLILKPVSMGLGFTVLPSHAVMAFHSSRAVTIHRLANKVSETLYIGTHRHKFIPSRVNQVMSDIEQCLKDRHE
jgi:DNA-binding transcriptional LysR family regulator